MVRAEDAAGNGDVTMGGDTTRADKVAVTPPKRKKRRSAGSGAEIVREALTRAGGMAVPPSPSSLRQPPLKHKNITIRAQVELSSAKPTVEFTNLVRNLLAELQKRANRTRLESVVSGEGVEPISVPSKVTNDVTLLQRHVDLNNQNLRRYKPWGRNKDTTETDDDGLASPTPRFAICISTNVEPETLVNTVRPWFQEHGGILSLIHI